MDLFRTSALITVTCPKRLAPYLAREVEELGFTLEETFVTGVRLYGTMEDCITLNLNLRCASQVLYSLQRFTAANADDVYAALHAYPWEEIIPEKGYFSVTSNVLNDTINNSMFANLRVKDAIADRLKTKRGYRPDTGSALTGAVVHLFWKNNGAEVFVDSSGDSLGRHGYRKIPGQAPMLESLAAATILATNWDRRSPFVNPMCGSGTLAIEAAMSGRWRDYASSQQTTIPAQWTMPARTRWRPVWHTSSSSRFVISRRRKSRRVCPACSS